MWRQFMNALDRLGSIHSWDSFTAWFSALPWDLQIIFTVTAIGILVFAYAAVSATLPFRPMPIIIAVLGVYFLYLAVVDYLLPTLGDMRPQRSLDKVEP